MNRRGFVGRLLGIGAALVGLQLPKPTPKAEPVQTEPTIKWGQITLHPKKVACLIKVPNELIRSYHLDVTALNREGGF